MRSKKYGRYGYDRQKLNEARRIITKLKKALRNRAAKQADKILGELWEILDFAFTDIDEDIEDYVDEMYLRAEKEPVGESVGTHTLGYDESLQTMRMTIVHDNPDYLAGALKAWFRIDNYVGELLDE